MTEHIATRLHIPDALVPGAEIVLGDAAAHRLQHVLRVGLGAAVVGFNGRDGEWLCRIAARQRGAVTLHIVERLRSPESAADLWLLFAPIKRTRLDWLVEKATELGVATFVPVITARTQPERLNRDRLRALAVAAAEQSERLTVPDVRAPEPFGRVLTAWPGERLLLVGDETGGGIPIAETLGAVPIGAPAAFFAGPEGGFTETELDALGKLPIVTRVGLGPRVLRAETAALAALSVFQAIAGDWRQRRVR